MTDNYLKIVNNFGYITIWTTQGRRDLGCYKGNKPVKVNFSLGRDRHNKLSIDLLNLML